MLRRSLIALSFIVSGCGRTRVVDDEFSLSGPVIPVEPSREIAPRDSGIGYNGLALYRDSVEYLIASSSTANRIDVFNSSSGAFIRSVGKAGPGINEFRGPAGVVTLGDSIALVVETDNARVQGFHLPDFAPLGTFGDQIFRHPVAIAGYRAGNAYEVYVSDQKAPSFARIEQFRLSVGKRELIAIHWRTFGDSSGYAAISTAGAVAVDSASKRVLAVDASSDRSRVVVFGTDGRFASRTFNGKKSGATIASLAIYQCDKSSGYLAAGDAGGTIAVFDRETLNGVGKVSAGVSPTGMAAGGVLFQAQRAGPIAVIPWSGVVSALRESRVCSSGHTSYP